MSERAKLLRWVWEKTEPENRFHVNGEPRLFVRTRYGMMLLPTRKVTLEQLKRLREKLCFKNLLDPATELPMTRERKEALLCERLSSEEKLVKRDGSVWLMVGRPGGPWLVPIEQLTDEEIDQKVRWLQPTFQGR